MADDDKGAGHPPSVGSGKDGPSGSEHPDAQRPDASASESDPPRTAPPSLVRSPMSEWTASDRRGPIEQASDTDVERFVPAHELDAEGGLDRPVEPTSAGPASASPDDAPRVTGEAPVAPSAAEPRSDGRTSLVPIAAGLVVGAIIGAGSAWLVYSQGQGSDEPQKIASLNARIDALEKRPAAAPDGADGGKLRADVTELQGKVAALDKTAASSPSGPSTSSERSGASDGALAAKVAALGAAIEAMQAKGGAASQGDHAEVATLQSGLADARRQATDARSGLDAVEAGQKQLDDKVAALTAAVTGTQKQAQGAQADIDGMRRSQVALEGKLGSPALAVVADSLVQRIGAGQPYGRQVDALAGFGADPAKIAVLREGATQGVPSAPTLAARWKPLVEPVIATGNRAPANAGFGQRLEHGLFGLVSVRRADGTVGDDLASRVDLIAADLAANDVPGAYKIWQALPADAKARSADWGAQAKTSAEALTAASGLQQQAIDALGAKKS